MSLNSPQQDPMSFPTLTLTDSLRSFTAAELAAIIRLRRPRRTDTLLAIADSLIQIQNLQQIFRLLTTVETTALSDTTVFATSPASWQRAMVKLGLAVQRPDGTASPLTAVSDFAQSASTNELSTASTNELGHTARRWNALLGARAVASAAPIADPGQPATNSAWQLTAATAVSQLTFLCSELVLKPATLTVNDTLPNAKLQSLAQRLGLTNTQTAALLHAALSAELLTSENGYTAAGRALKGWLHTTVAARWEHLVKAVAPGLSKQLLAEYAARSATELSSNATALQPGTALQLGTELLNSLPAQTPTRKQRILLSDTLLNLLGLTESAAFTAAGRELFADLDWFPGAIPTSVVAQQIAVAELPQATKIIMQPDLTAVATGILDPDIERILLELAEFEQAGLASIYRFTQFSIARGFLANTRSAKDWEALLQTHSYTEVPSQLSFLLQEIENSNRVLQLRKASAGEQSAHAQKVNPLLPLTVVHTRTDEIAKQLLADRALSSLGLTVSADPHTLFCATRIQHAKNLLTQAHYLVAEPTVLAAATATTTSAVSSAADTTSVQQSIILDAQDSASINATTHEQNMQQTLDLAHELLTAKSHPLQTTIDYALHNGAVLQLELQAGNRTLELQAIPKALLGDRLRLAEPQRDVERTVPLSAITVAQLISTPTL